MLSKVRTYDYVAELDSSELAASRYSALSEAFRDRFGSTPDVFGRAPGRVNLIGEHIDYMGYGVLPMAIQQDTVVAIRCHGSEVHVTNKHADKFKDCVYGTDPSQEVDTSNHQWANYFMAAYKGVFEFLKSKGIDPKPIGVEAMVHGTVPQGSGLSSSSSLVCATALALLAALGQGDVATPAEVAEFACTCERYVGTQSGGMDQAISMMAASGIAKLITFNPVEAEDVILPQNAVFVIANSLAESQKAVTADRCYNLRVVECRLAAAVLCIALGRSREEALKVQTLKEVETQVPIGPGDDRATACINVARKHLHEAAYTQHDIEQLLGQPLSDVLSDNPASMRVVKTGGLALELKLRDRAVHVWSEAARVPAFRDACNDDMAAASVKLQRLADLMNASHASCRDLYECSCPELEKLVSDAKEAGALSCRLTGAGWGGCTVSLVAAGKEEEFISAVREKYYKPLVDSGKLKDESWENVIFASKPGSGGGILRLRS